MRRIAWYCTGVCIFFIPFVSVRAFGTTHAALILILLVSMLIAVRGRLVSFSPCDSSVFLLFALYVSSSLLVARTPVSIRSLYLYLYPLALYWTVRSAPGSYKRELVWILVASALAVSLYSLRAFFIVSRYVSIYLKEHGLHYAFAEDFISRGRAFVPFISPNLLAGYLSMALFLCAGQFLKIKKHAKPGAVIFCVITISVSAFAFICTKSLGAWASFFLAAALFVFLINIRGRTALLITGAVLAVLLLVVFLRLMPSTHYLSLQYSFADRLTYWNQTIQLIRAHPLCGVGTGNFNLPATRLAHNSYLQLWAETGIAGFGIFIFIIYRLFTRTGRLIRSEKLDPFDAGCAGAAAGFLIHNLIDYTFFIPQVSFLWWVILAIYGKKQSVDADACTVGTQDKTDSKK